MFGILAFAWFALAYILNGSQARTDSWFTPQQLMYVGLAFLALHVAGGITNRKP